MKFTLILALIALPFFCTPAMAGEWSLQISGFAYHYDRELTKEMDLREVNPGFAVAYEDGHKIATLGGYKNSYGKSSYYFFTGWQWHLTSWLHAGAMVGIISGYEMDTGYPITPAAVPFVSVGPLNFTVTPWFAAMNVTVLRF